MNDNQIVQRALEAAKLLENPILKEIWEGSRNEAIEALETCSLTKDEASRRDELLWHLQMVKKQKAMMIGMIRQGEFAQHKIDNRKQETRVQSLFRKVVNG